MVPRDRAIISVFYTKQPGGKEGTKEETALLGVYACLGKPGSVTERLILVQCRNLALHNNLLKARCETKTMLIS